MSEVQIAIIDQENTQIALAVPGVQGPAGAISSGGSANQVFYKVSGTNYDAGWTFIGNANVDAAAAIAGTKISPNFGSQTVATTGVFSHALGSQGAPTITFTGDTNTGIYSPGADQVAISTGGSGRLFINSNGDVTVGHTSSSYSAAGRGLISVNGSSSSLLDLQTGTTSRFRMFCNGTTTELVNSEATGNLVFGTNNTERLRITSAGLVGIGTSSPSSALDVSGAISLGAVALPSAGTARIFSRNTDSNLYIQTGSGNTLNFLDGSQNTMASFGSSTVTLQTGNSPRLSIDSSGRVGIGTTSPGAKLQVETSADDDGITINSELVSRPKQLYFRYSNIGSGGAVKSDGPLTFWSGSGTPFERCRLDGSGRLLVGTSSSVGDGSSQIQLANSAPSLQVHRNANDAFQAGIVLSKARGSSNQVVQNGDTIGTVSFQGADGSNAYFITAAQIAAVVDAPPGANDMPGRLVFSTTADGASSPTERMMISNNGQLNLFVTNIDGFQVRNSLAAGTSRANFVGRFSATDTLSGTVSYLVYTNGNVQNTNNSYGALSDIKLKENIVDANSQWDDIKALQVRNYNLKEGQTHRQIGLIAQEVDPISPGLVYESPDRDEDGNDLGTVTKSVNYSVLYMKAVKALQEAMERIEVLEQRLTDAGID